MKTPHVKYLIPITYHSKTIAKVKVFEKYRRQTSRSRSQGQKSRSQMKILITRNLHVKYESPTTYGSRDIANAKVFEK